MTVLTKGKFMSVDSAKLPLVQEMLFPETKIAVPPTAPPTAPVPTPPPRGPASSLRRRSVAVLFHIMNISLLLILFIAMGVMIYRQYARTTVVHRYQGYCTIPIENKDSQLIEPNRMPLRWSNDPDVQVMSTVDETATDQFLNVLREELDIEGMVEKISVLNNGHQVNFIHDFSNNVTNIVDEDRCFTMELDPELVLVPEAFILSIEHGGEFDVTRVRSALRALLPAVRELSALPGPCRTRPTYRLRRDEDHQVHKRSVEAQSHDYMHFSGKHIHEIEIGNLEELLQYEKNKTKE
ncbi:uncharacterized protein [Battus philenor]|uniref:uncharacterized protein n=1 Tax=Battus philenor TaxID=42288 RepID=UPI0035CFABA1